MSRFFNHYVDSEARSAAHKLAFFTTVFMPLIALGILLTGAFSAPLAVALAALVIGVYIFALVMLIPLLINKEFSYAAPLLITTLAGPAYASLLFFTDPSLTGAGGLVLWGVLPGVAVIGFLVDEFNHFRNAEPVIEELAEELTEETQELEKVE